MVTDLVINTSLMDAEIFSLLFSILGMKPQNFGLTFLTFIILFNNLIPISLPVTLEVSCNEYDSICVSLIFRLFQRPGQCLTKSISF